MYVTCGKAVIADEMCDSCYSAEGLFWGYKMNYSAERDTVNSFTGGKLQGSPPQTLSPFNTRAPVQPS
jgi:hypothetical protein